MKANVYHFVVRKDESYEQARNQAQWPYDYVQVATVNASDVEEATAKTITHDEPWWKHAKAVNPTGTTKTGDEWWRSTMDGDIIEIDGKLWRCELRQRIPDSWLLMSNRHKPAAPRRSDKRLGFWGYSGAPRNLKEALEMKHSGKFSHLPRKMRAIENLIRQFRKKE